MGIRRNRKTNSVSKIGREAKDMEKVESVEWFMRSEYDRLTEMLLYTKEMGQKRVQFWLTVVSAVGGLLAILYQMNGDGTSFFGITVVALFGILLLGVVIFLKLVQRTITSVEYIRAQGKIKRYFVNKEPSVERFFYFPVTDDKPTLKHSFAFTLTGSSMRLLVVVINSFLISGIVSLIPCLVYGNWSMLGYQIVMAIAAFVLSFTFHEAFTTRRFRRAEIETASKIEFPTKQ